MSHDDTVRIIIPFPTHGHFQISIIYRGYILFYSKYKKIDQKIFEVRF